METVESLIQYCQENRRVCPNPIQWNQLWEMLPNKRQKDVGWEPPLPLILGAWQEPALFKMVRLAEHIRWADEQGCLAQISSFLRDLDETDWFHLDE